MSFTSSVKNEVSKLNTIETENIAELSALIRNIGILNENSIKIITENSSVARRIFGLLKDIYGVTPRVTVRKGYNYNKNLMYLLEVKYKMNVILEDLSLYQDNNYLVIPKEYILGDNESERAYLRGLFLSIGSINDPKKSRYHLEFLVDNEEYALFLVNLLNHFLLNAKYIKRDNKYMIYIKEAEKISDFLRLIRAYNGVMYYEEIRVYREKINMTNRLNNCEQANVEKMVATSNKLIAEINFIKGKNMYDLLDEKIRESAEYRIRYPETSLLELSKIMTLETGSNISKSCLNHRFRKIKEIISKQIE